MTHIRKEIWLQKPVVKSLQERADKEQRSLKNYIELKLQELVDGKLVAK